MDVPNLRFHDLCHSYAVMQIQAGDADGMSHSFESLPQNCGARFWRWRPKGRKQNQPLAETPMTGFGMPKGAQIL